MPVVITGGVAEQADKFPAVMVIAVLPGVAWTFRGSGWRRYSVLNSSTQQYYWDLGPGCVVGTVVPVVWLGPWSQLCGWDHGQTNLESKST